ncbi:MAG: DNA replication/repair protein RecF [Acidobacteria bacterium]|nr:DNA replication/repair protein RecF [Acidobacteriota bacterium]
MYLRSVEATGFRNLATSIEFGPGLNILWGRNAQGKTSVLEAIYILANTKSFRTSTLRDAIAHGASEAIVRGVVEHGAVRRELKFRVAGARKEFFVNEKRESTVDYITQLDAIVFSFEELGVVRGEPAERRRFLDRGVVALRPAYLRTIADYNRILRQKSRLLRDAAEAEDANPGRAASLRSTVGAWNEQLVELGAEMHRERTAYVDRLNAVLARNLFDERLDVRYVSSFEGKGDLDAYEQLYRSRLDLRFDAELASGRALIGPHRDDLEVRVAGRDVDRFGSAGQQRSALLILDLAQVDVYYEAFEEYPILLIDDIDAELDRDRIDRLLGRVEGKAQTFISTSKHDIAESFRSRAEIFSVRDGGVVREVSGASGVRGAGRDAETGES